MFHDGRRVVGEIDMSQFMICKAKADLIEHGGILRSLNDKDDTLIRSILKLYYPENQFDDIWIIQNMEHYCCKQLYYDDFFASELYHLIDNLYDLCDWMIFWYGNEYTDLDEIHTKNELISYVQHQMEMPCCELYIRVCKYNSSKDMLHKKIESGKQLGISVRVEKENNFYWYSYAIQKVDNIYFVYECEIDEDNMANEEYEYETVNKYSSFDEVEKNFVSKYDINFSDVGPLKGQYIFNPKFY